MHELVLTLRSRYLEEIARHFSRHTNFFFFKDEKIDPSLISLDTKTKPEGACLCQKKKNEKTVKLEAPLHLTN